MNLNHLSETQRQAVRTGTVARMDTCSAGHTIRGRDGKPCCAICLMPVTLDDRGGWVYAA